MKKREQFISICTAIYNDQFKQAAIECVAGGFMAKDLIEKFNSSDNSEEVALISMEDIAIVAEMAAEIRG
jgi:hypothetical protein